MGAQKKIDDAENQKEIEEKKKLEEEAKLAEEKEKLEGLAKEVAAEMEKLELKVEACTEASKPFMTGGKPDCSSSELLEAIEASEKALNEGDELLRPTAVSLNEKSALVKKQPEIWKLLEQEFTALRQRMTPCRKTLREVRMAAEAWKKKVSRLVSEEKRLEEQKAIF